MGKGGGEITAYIQLLSQESKEQELMYSKLGALSSKNSSSKRNVVLKLVGLARFFEFGICWQNYRCHGKPLAIGQLKRALSPCQNRWEHLGLGGLCARSEK